MIVLDNSIYLHFPKTGGTFIKSWIRQNLSDYTKFCQPLIHQGTYSLEDLNYVKSTLNQQAKDHFDTWVKNDTLDWVFVKIQHLSFGHLDPSFTEGKKIFFFVRNPVDWIYSKIKFGVQVSAVNNMQESLDTELARLDWHSSSLRYLDDHNADIFMMKYEYLYFNIIKMLELSGVPLTNDIIKTLIIKDKLNHSIINNGQMNQVCKVHHLEEMLSHFDNRILDLYQNPEVTLKKLKNFQK